MLYLTFIDINEILLKVAFNTINHNLYCPTVNLVAIAENKYFIQMVKIFAYLYN
jgi:hypothetical protein